MSHISIHQSKFSNICIRVFFGSLLFTDFYLFSQLLKMWNHVFRGFNWKALRTDLNWFELIFLHVSWAVFTQPENYITTKNILFFKLITQQMYFDNYKSIIPDNVLNIVCVSDRQMYRCYRCVYLVDGGFEERCGWKSCRSDRTAKENSNTSDSVQSVESKGEWPF